MTADTAEIDDMEMARRIFRAKGHIATRSARKARHKHLTGSVDRRSLRATGRTEQFNFRCAPDLKPRAQEAAAAAGITLAAWMELAVENMIVTGQATEVTVDA